MDGQPAYFNAEVGFYNFVNFVGADFYGDVALKGVGARRLCKTVHPVQHLQPEVVRQLRLCTSYRVANTMLLTL